jgi:hypothetical protein
MISRRTAAVLLGSATLGLVAAAAGPAAAHPGHAGEAKGAKHSPAAAKARAHRAHVRAFRRAVRHCSLSEGELLTAKTNPRLAKVAARLAEKVKKGEITQERADRRYAWIQKRVTIRVTMLDAKRAPVLELFGVTTPAEFRAKLKEHRGLRRLIKATDGVTRADFRAARRAGAKAGRDAVIALCAADDAGTEKAAA